MEEKHRTLTHQLDELRTTLVKHLSDVKTGTQESVESPPQQQKGPSRENVEAFLASLKGIEESTGEGASPLTPPPTADKYDSVKQTVSNIAVSAT